MFGVLLAECLDLLEGVSAVASSKISNLLERRLELLGVCFVADCVAAGARLLEARHADMPAEGKWPVRSTSTSYSARLRFGVASDIP
jgi:hypothetical protein